MPCAPPGPGQIAASSSTIRIHHRVVCQFSPSCSRLPQHKANLSEISEATIAEDLGQHLMAVVSMSYLVSHVLSFSPLL